MKKNNSQQMKITLIFLTLGLFLVGPVWAINYAPDDLTVLGGTYTSGNVFSLEFHDSDFYIITEDTAAPYLELRANFTNLGGLENETLEIFGLYDGNPAHSVNVSLWDGAAWVPLVNIPDNPAGAAYNLNASAYIVNGNLWVRFHHLGSGSAGHTLELDLLRLNADIESDMVGQTQWFYLAIWGMILVLAILWKKPPAQAIGGIYGWFVGFQIMAPINTFIALVFFSLNLYIVYDSLDNWDRA